MTITVFAVPAGMTLCSFSIPTPGLTTQVMSPPFSLAVTQPRPHPMQGAMSSSLPSFALIAKSGSARRALPRTTMSASPRWRMSSAMPGVVILPTTMTGTSTDSFIFFEYSVFMAKGVPAGGITGYWRGYGFYSCS